MPDTAAPGLSLFDRRRITAPLGHVIRPFARTGGYYARSWGDYLDQLPGEFPARRPSLALAGHAFRDELVILGFRLQQPHPQAATVERVDREVSAALEIYEHKGWLDHPAGFFPAPPPLTDVSVRPVHSVGRNYERIVFDSEYAPHVGEPGAGRWSDYRSNTPEYALMLRHREPRPWLVCVHGAAMGRAAVDMALFHAWHYYRDLGLNVVLPVLPIHGPRARGLPADALFPGADLLNAVHMVTQAVWDIRRVLTWIRLQQPGARIGLNGMSLGGLVSSLVASLDDELACAILGVPVADLFEVLGRHGGLSRDDPAFQTLQRAMPISRMISPLGMAPRVPREGRFVYAGVADRLVHPREQVERLWEHWDRPELHWFRGGHTGFFRSHEVQNFIDDALDRSGLVGKRRR